MKAKKNSNKASLSGVVHYEFAKIIGLEDYSEAVSDQSVRIRIHKHYNPQIYETFKKIDNIRRIFNIKLGVKNLITLNKAIQNDT